MVEISDVVLCSPESIRLMDNEFGFVVESFNGAVVDGCLGWKEQKTGLRGSSPNGMSRKTPLSSCLAYNPP